MFLFTVVLIILSFFGVQNIIEKINRHHFPDNYYISEFREEDEEIPESSSSDESEELEENYEEETKEEEPSGNSSESEEKPCLERMGGLRSISEEILPNDSKKTQ